MSSSNKKFTFQAKRKPDNEKKTLKQPHYDAFTLKQDCFERIKGLHKSVAYWILNIYPRFLLTI